MNIAIIGLGNIGIYHIRDFIKLGCKIKAIINSNYKSSKTKSLLIKQKYNIDVNIYSNIDELLEKEKIELILITSSTETHYKYVKKCVEYNINFFCEKPFIYNIENNNTELCKDIIEKCINNNLNINIQTQWPYGIRQIKHLLDTDLNHITLYMEHFKTCDNIDFFTENISHMNSVIIYLLGIKKITNLKYIVSDKYPKIISFYYGDCYIEYKLGNPKKRKIIYTFNDKIFERVTDTNYNQFFMLNNDYNNLIRFDDPFFLSIKNYLENTSIINIYDIFKNVEMMEEILECVNKYINFT